MPVYEFQCSACGPFDVRRGMREATDPSHCPACGQLSHRVYTVPGGRSPGSLLSSTSRRDAARIDRARGGEPVVTGPPSGRRLPLVRQHRH
jgi:putative FmdB family regulatory protein